MSGALALGPLSLTYGLLVALAGGLVGTLAGKVAGQHASVDIGPALLRIALVGLVSARLAFVVQLQHAYLKAPLDIRDGGWSPLAGLALPRCTRSSRGCGDRSGSSRSLSDWVRPARCGCWARCRCR